MKKNTSVRGLILISLMSLVPLVALAQAGVEVTRGIGTFGDIINTVTQSIVRSLATLFATAAMAAFFFGIVQFIWGTRNGDSTKMTNGKNFMLWGLVALFVMFSVWGIIIYTQRIFGIQGQNTILIPNIEIKRSGSTPAPSPLGGTPQTEYTCPDGKTKYYDQSDYRLTCTGTAATPQTEYTCPDGKTKYYDQSDYRLTCTGTAATPAQSDPPCQYSDPSRCPGGAAD